jgi:hypothetical protein
MLSAVHPFAWAFAFRLMSSSRAFSNACLSFAPFGPFSPFDELLRLDGEGREVVVEEEE